MSREVNKRSFSSKISNDFASAILFMKSIDAPTKTSEVLSSDKEKVTTRGGPRGEKPGGRRGFGGSVVTSPKSCFRFFTIQAFHLGLEIETPHSCPPFE